MKIKESLTFGDHLDSDNDLWFFADDEDENVSNFINREDAIKIVEHLTKVFELDGGVK